MYLLFGHPGTRFARSSVAQPSRREGRPAGHRGAVRPERSEGCYLPLSI